ncbi:LLM class flavin-dependent oxidoreductase [Paraburkholderia sp. BCC1886]|uniref:LLM class flavin-dependent oxidoreductase n=1 Tax=Paraburkholderia sp. BCC1886 TaxID=2562670 RepID=UPI001182ADDB|nr:LLM class flavin-dependent oxidoreductase [Paraburkholderia sp. BCC1886]
MIPFSVLDLSPVTAGATPAQAFKNTLDLAQHAEKWNYQRYWLAEHHNMTGIASAATSVVIGYVAGGTTKIRVGSGGIMLPNHAPLVIAEQFGTLASLYPDRIDLGLGRAPGTDQSTARALRRDLQNSADSFPDDVVELQRYFADAVPGQRIRAVPGTGLHVPLWLLGSSLFSAQLAAALGLPFAFASHFAPDYMMTALKVYREQFRPSATLDKPHAMVGVNLFAADTNEEARRMFTSLQQQFINLRRGTPGKLQPPVDRIEASPGELNNVAHSLSCTAIGDREAVKEALLSIIAQTGADELMLTGQIYDHAARLRSFEIGAQIRDELSREQAGEHDDQSATQSV